MADTETDAVELVRVLIPDTDQVFGENDDEYLFSDGDLEKFLKVAGGSITRAAGLAMIAVGNSEALISKVIKTQDLMTNGAAVSASFLKSGEALLARADKEDESTALDFFQIIDYKEGWYPQRPELTEWTSPWV